MLVPSAPSLDDIGLENVTKLPSGGEPFWKSAVAQTTNSWGLTNLSISGLSAEGQPVTGFLLAPGCGGIISLLTCSRHLASNEYHEMHSSVACSGLHTSAVCSGLRCSGVMCSGVMCSGVRCLSSVPERYQEPSGLGTVLMHNCPGQLLLTCSGLH